MNVCPGWGGVCFLLKGIGGGWGAGSVDHLVLVGRRESFYGGFIY